MTTSASSHSHATTSVDAAIAAETARATAAEAALSARIAKLEGVTPQPPPPPSGGAFLSYPASSAKVINGGTSVEVAKLSFSGAKAVAVVIQNANGVYLHDLDFDACVGGIFLIGCTGALTIQDIRARNTGDGTVGSGHSNVIQLNNVFTGGLIQRVKALGGNTEDMISIFQSGGASAASPLVIQDCQLQGLLTDTPTAKAWTSASGSGMMLGDANTGTQGHILVQRVTMLDTGQVGGGIVGGTDITYQNCILYGHRRIGPPASNVGLSSENYSGSSPYGPHKWLNNRVFWLDGAGQANPDWVGPQGTPLTSTGNVWQDTTIDPATLAVVL